MIATSNEANSFHVECKTGCISRTVLIITPVKHSYDSSRYPLRCLNEVAGVEARLKPVKWPMRSSRTPFRRRTHFSPIPLLNAVSCASRQSKSERQKLGDLFTCDHGAGVPEARSQAGNRHTAADVKCENLWKNAMNLRVLPEIK